MNPIDNVLNVIQLNSDEIEYFKALFRERSFKKKELILRAGDVCQYETYVIKGCLRIYYNDDKGVEHVVKFAVDDWWALDLQSFELQTPAFYTIQALEDTATIQISKADHDRLYEAIPKFEKFGRLRYQNSYVLLQNRMTQHLFSTAEERYEHFKLKYPGLEQRISQKHIASYLGITPEFLSMMRHKRMSV
jgi:CRP-like cAMP-binding protein